MIRTILVAISVWLAAGPCLAQTGSNKTPTQLNAEINSLFPDNTNFLITPFDLRQITLDMVASSGQTANNVFTAQAYGADPTGVVDSSTAIQACLTAAGVSTVKGTCLVAGGKYQVIGNLSIPRGVTLSCGDSFYDQEDGFIASFAAMPAIMLDSGHTITEIGPGTTIKNCLIYRNGMTFPAANSSAYAGIAITDNIGTITVKDTVILGFDTCFLNQSGSARPFLLHVHCDATGITHAAMEFDQGNTDSGVVRDIKIQPIATGNGSCTNSVRAGTGFRVTNRGGPVVYLDEAIVQNFQVAQFDFESETFGGQIWSDGINGTGANCGPTGFGSSIGVLVGAGSSIQMNSVSLNAQQTGMKILSNGAQSWVGQIGGSCFGQDAIVLGDATHSGNLDVGSIGLNGIGCTGASPRYAVNVIHANTSFSGQHVTLANFNSNSTPYFQASISTLLQNNPPNFYINNLTTDLSAGTNPYASNYSAGAGSSPVLEGITASIGSCTGLGSGTCGAVNGLSNGLQGMALLSPTGSPGTSGTVVVTFPLSNSTYACVASLSGGTSNWPSSSSVQAATTNGTVIDLNWVAGSALTAGQTYRISYICKPQ